MLKTSSGSLALFFDIISLHFSLWLFCHPAQQVSRSLTAVKSINELIKHKSHFIIMRKTMHVRHGCDSNMYDSKSCRAAFSRQDCCQIPRPNCFLLLTLWSSCLLATQHANNTTEGSSPLWRYTCYFSLAYMRDLYKRWGATINEGGRGEGMSLAVILSN